jgi:integrase
MMFHAMLRSDLGAGSSWIRLVDEQGREIEWANAFLDRQVIRGLQPLSISSYAYTLLHFVRWWSLRPGVDVMQFKAEQFTESTLIDYVRDQLNEVPKPAPENVNRRSSMLRRLFQFYFQQDMPHAPYLIQRNWYRRSPLGYGRGRVPAASADLKLKVPQRVVVPLSTEQVERFWHSFHKARDMAMVALMLLNGLRSREVLGLKLEDLLFSEAQIHVHGKGGRQRRLPLPPETIDLLKCYLNHERPLTNAPEVFVALKGPARGKPLKTAGLRSLFRHHRQATGVKKANPHRFRHTFGSEMVRAGISLPARQRLMGHAYIHTTMLYIHLTPQDVFTEYVRAVDRLTEERRAR